MTRSEASPTVTALVKIPRRKEYSVALSDGRQLRVVEEDLSRFSLVPGLGLGEASIEEIERAYEYARARMAALRLLRVRPRTEGELRCKLHTKGLDEAALERVLESLKASGAVDDKVFTRLWTEEKVGRRVGRRRILAELRAKQVDPGTARDGVAQVYEAADELENARQAAVGRLARLASISAEAKRRRIYDFLVRRGFDSDVAREATQYAMAAAGERG
jgi:regulatory protein